MLAPIVFGLAMSLSAIIYNAIAGKLALEHFMYKFALYYAFMAVIDFAYILVVSVVLGLLYIIGVSREYVPDYTIKGTSV